MKISIIGNNKLQEFKTLFDIFSKFNEIVEKENAEIVFVFDNDINFKLNKEVLIVFCNSIKDTYKKYDNNICIMPVDSNFAKQKATILGYDETSYNPIRIKDLEDMIASAYNRKMIESIGIYKTSLQNAQLYHSFSKEIIQYIKGRLELVKDLEKELGTNYTEFAEMISLNII